MRSLIRNATGAAAIEFAIVVLPFVFFMVGIIQTGYLVWVDNLLHAAVDTAARCGAVNSTTTPCVANDMVSAANTVFAPLSGGAFTVNTGTCNGSGLTGTYTVSIGFVMNVTLTTQSCYPTVSAPP